MAEASYADAHPHHREIYTIVYGDIGSCSGHQITVNRISREQRKSAPTGQWRRSNSKTQKTARAAGQETIHNPSPTQYLQVGMGFNLRLAMDILEKMTGAAMTLTDTGRPLCERYDLKNVCNSNFGGRHVHRRLMISKNGLVAVFKAQLCEGDVTTCDKGRCGVARSNHYELEKLEDKDRALGVGSDNIPHIMDTHVCREDGRQRSISTTGCYSA